MIDGLHFLRPYWLWLLPLTTLLLWWIMHRQKNSNTWQSLCDPHLLEAQLQVVSGRRHWLPCTILGTAWLLAIIALAGPSWQQQEVPVYNRLASRLILFDLSRSMDSNDLAPSRLVRARYKLNDLVSGAGARQQALVVFAGDSFVVSPFTDDRETLLNLIPSLTTDTVPVQGSRTDKALELARGMIENADVNQVQIVLITDGIDPRSQQLATALAADDHEVNVIGVGTSEGAPVALADGSLLKDKDGNIVVPGVDHQAMIELAGNGNGRYFHLAADGSDIRWLNRPESTTNPVVSGVDNAVQGSSGTLRWEDSGIWLLLPLALLASYGFRRGVLLLLVIGIALPGQEAMAFGWADLWQRPDQQAHQALENDRPGAVPEQSPPSWRGAAAYRQQDYGLASQMFAGDNSADGAFNRGNALANSGQLEAAVDAYEQALDLDPEMEDARHNRDLIRSLLNQQPVQRSAGENSRQSENNDSTDGDQSTQGEPRQSGGDPGRNPEQAKEDNHKTSNNQIDNDDLEKRYEQENMSGEGSKPDFPTSDPGQQNRVAEPGPTSEDQQSLQQWLNQVPDDPGGLLRRKFRFQYSQRPTRPEEPAQW